MEAKDMHSMLEQVEADRKELFTLKMNVLAGQVKDVSQFKKLRKKIARALTQVSAARAAASKNSQDAS